jgi:hypothetical protein
LKVSVVLWVMAGESPSGGLRRLGFHTCPILSSENGQVPKVRTLLPFLFRAAQKRVTTLRAGLHHRPGVPVPTLALVSCGPHQGWGLSAGSLPLPTVSCLHSKGHPAVTAGPPRDPTGSQHLPRIMSPTVQPQAGQEQHRTHFQGSKGLCFSACADQ